MYGSLWWRVSTLALAFGRVTCLASFGGAIALAAFGLRQPGADVPALTVVILALPLLGWAVYRLAIVPWVVVGASGIGVQNPFGHHHVAWEDFRDAASSPGGIVIRLVGGRELIAWAVQKSAWATWRKKHTRADDLVRAIDLEAAKARALVVPTGFEPVSPP